MTKTNRVALIVAFVLSSLAVWKTAHSTITNQTSQTVSSLGNGIITSYTISFPFQSNSDIKVYLRSTSGVTTALNYGGGANEFTITGGDPGTTVVMGTAPTTLQRVVIQRNTPITQDVDYNENAAFPFSDHEEQMDKNILVLQELDRELDTKIGLSSASSNSAPVFPDPIADKFVLYNHLATDLTLAPSNTPATGDTVRFNGTGWSTFNIDSALSPLATSAALAAHLADLNNPHQTTATQIGGNSIMSEINLRSGTIDWVRVNKSGSALTDLASRSHTQLTDIGTNTHAQIDSHINNTSNPHSVTAAQVGNATAQWNANKIQGKTVDDSAIANGKALTYNSVSGNIEYQSASSGSAITSLTGDVTASGPGAAAATLATVTVAKGGTGLTAVGAASTIPQSNGSALYYSTIVDSNIASGAAISRSKIAASGINAVVINDGNGNLSAETRLASSRGGTGISLGSSTGGLIVTSGVASVSTVPISQGGTNATTPSEANRQLIPSVINVPTSAIIDWSLSNAFESVVSASTDYQFSNQTPGQTITIGVSTRGTGVPVIKWPVGSAASAVHWTNAGNAPPTQTNAKMDLYTFIRLGSSTFGSVIQSFN